MDSQEIKVILTYIFALVFTIFIWYNFRIDTTTVKDVVYCGEVLDRWNKSAAPRTEAEYRKWNDCVFQGIKEWPNEQRN